MRRRNFLKSMIAAALIGCSDALGMGEFALKEAPEYDCTLIPPDGITVTFENYPDKDGLYDALCYYNAYAAEKSKGLS